ncbi:hypothetical protein [Pedobacter ureilyticus]|uniref:DUF2945 domain-containing protein n=1 Tax=Pedobacter ureilyticus TaxID=1393051 RepID=A0ABW9J1S6_9SPHI|nr:hypothetical protein [Pedobacter helvus]
MIEQKHWAEALKSGDKVLGTIRHATDGNQNRINVELSVIENFPTASKIIAKEGKTETVVPYNELTKIK